MKPTYASLLTKDDKLFLKHAKKALAFDYDNVMSNAQQAYESHSRASVAKREANLVILSALKEIGEEYWRPSEDKEKPERIQVKPATLPQRSPKKKWEGKSILDMADEKRANKRR